MKAVFSGLLAAMVCAAGLARASEKEDALAAMIPAVFSDAQAQYRLMLEDLKAFPTNDLPHTFEKGALKTVKPKGWTSGFFPGSLWYLYEYTHDDAWKNAALAYTQRLEPIRNFTENHDIGFMLYCSYGNGLRLSNPPGYKEVLLDGAAALCTRYNEKLGLIRSWNSYNFPVIVDNMMNLELLMWASKNGGDGRFATIAKSHANTTNVRHFRADGSAFHIIDYNVKTGKILGYHAGQGASADAPWARGQMWGLYGFTMMYRETRDAAYLQRAITSAEFLINHPHLPADKVPFWDFEASAIPNEPRDASSAAIMASALLELCTYVEGERARRYYDVAVTQLLSLSSPVYRAKVGENGHYILMHCVSHLPGNVEIDVPLCYADYYYLEALLRFNKLRK